jgi:hypothetical protein
LGREYYEQITDLLNAINNIRRYHHPWKKPWDATSLNRMVNRMRKRARAVLAAPEYALQATPPTRA